MANLVRRALDRAPLPRRGDHVEAWLKQQRDQFFRDSVVWVAFDQQLDDYRLHADTGTPLHEHCCEAGNVDDCAGCYDAKEAVDCLGCVEIAGRRLRPGLVHGFCDAACANQQEGSDA